MLRVLGDGDARYRLENDADVQVGWINGRAIGFRGFVTESDAKAGAIAAWRALDQVLRRQYPGWPSYEPSLAELQLVHDGAYEWFTDGTAPIARLLRPQRRAYDLTFGLELVLPSYASEGVAITAAHAVGAALSDAVVAGPFRPAVAAANSTHDSRSILGTRGARIESGGGDAA